MPKNTDAPILDIACGEGGTLDWLSGRYANLSGFDLSPENVQLCHEVGLDFVTRHDCLALAEFQPAQSFDCILALDILEHIDKEDAVGFLDAIRSRLNPGGSVVIRTPNMASIFATLMRHNDLTHRWGCTEATLRELLALSGFKNIHLFPEWNAATMRGGDAKYIFACCTGSFTSRSMETDPPYRRGTSSP